MRTTVQIRRKPLRYGRHGPVFNAAKALSILRLKLRTQFADAFEEQNRYD
jgi:hypothetical protein